MTRTMRARLLGATLLAPLGAVFALLLVVPLGIGLWYSFRVGSIFGIETTLTLDNYRQVLERDAFWTALRTSVVYGAGTAIASLLVGFAIARYVRFERPRLAGFIVGAVMLSVLGGYLVRIYAWRTLLSDNGVFNSALEQVGAIDGPLRLLFSPGAVILTLGSIYAPYATLLILAGLENVRDDELDAARDLGAGTVRTYRLVVLPLIGRSLLLAFSLVFLLAAADYVIPPLVGGPGTQMVGALVANQFLATGDTPMGAAFGFMTLLLLAFVVTLVWAAMRVLRLLPREGGRR
ncbi:spermidine/putrescine transport system permease protein [Conexibacter arvalis]|uniref:Spermidine/putrescine transport system permease protein n=1 Tax=Conexibacter arvalis TaxID=912552 RepID=A0A840IHW0_9ACTN|nr:spermidine/putrescine transport system permease protein [Conexibacter arvalis]